MSRLCPLLGTGGFPPAGPVNRGLGVLATCCAIHTPILSFTAGKYRRLTWVQLNLNEVLEATGRNGLEIGRLALTLEAGVYICPPGKRLPDRLMVRLRTLTPSIEVRILVGHPTLL